jgi:hypothetical protein
MDNAALLFDHVLPHAVTRRDTVSPELLAVTSSRLLAFFRGYFFRMMRNNSGVLTDFRYSATYANAKDATFLGLLESKSKYNDDHNAIDGAYLSLSDFPRSHRSF